MKSSDDMKILAVVLMIVAILGIVLSAFPNLGARNNFGNRSSFNTTPQNFNGEQQNFNRSAFGFSQIFLYLRVGLWIVVLVIAILLMMEKKKTKG